MGDDRKHPNPAETDPMVEFFLERQQFMDPRERYFCRPIVNGYTFEAEFGKKNRLPKSVVELLKSSKSAIIGQRGGMGTPHAVDTAVGGQGRAQGRIMEQTTEYEYIPDYNIVDEKVLSK